MNRFRYQCGSETIEIPVPESYRDCFKLARSDYFRYTGKHISIAQLLCTCLPQFRYNFWLRMSTYRNGWAHGLCSAMRDRLARLRNIHIAADVHIGYGLYISHGGDIDISSGTAIGNNCNIHRCTSIHSTAGNPVKIGNHVYLGHSIDISPDLYIESDTTVWNNTAVSTPVHAETTVSGSPMRTVGTHQPSLVHNRWAL